MRLPQVLVVTGTDTGVGKTVVTAALAAALAPDVAVYKPAQTGVGPGAAGDIAEVVRLSGVAAASEGVRLLDPLAPTTAARLVGARLPSVGEHAAHVEALACAHRHVLVEGAGGLLVGLDEDGAGLTDLAAALGVDFGFVIVARSGLGTLNHTALTAEALRSRGLPVLGIVIGSLQGDPDLAQTHNLHDLPRVTGLPILGRVPSGAAGLPVRDFRAQAPGWLRELLGSER